MATVSKINLGLDSESLQTSIKTKPYCRVTLYTGGQDEDGNAYYITSPLETIRPREEDEGAELVMDCPWANQTLADNLLNRIDGKVYQPFVAQNAIIDPLFEVGDAVNVGDVYSPIYRRVIYLDGLYTADISAPYKQDEDDEYPYEDNQEAMFEHLKKSINRVNASLTITNDTISILVDDTTGEITPAKIIAAINGTESYVTIQADKINMTGIVTYGSLAPSGGQGLDNILGTAGSTVINGGNITTGYISADRIGAGTIDADNIGVKDTFLVKCDQGNIDPETGEPLYEPSGYMGAAQGVQIDPATGASITTYGVALATSSGSIGPSTTDPYVIVTSAGARMSCNGNGIVVTNTGVFYRVGSGNNWTRIGAATFG